AGCPGVRAAPVAGQSSDRRLDDHPGQRLAGEVCASPGHEAAPGFGRGRRPGRVAAPIGTSRSERPTRALRDFRIPRPGFEPGSRESKARMLPLHHLGVIPEPGIEPGPAGSEPAVLAIGPHRIAKIASAQLSAELAVDVADRIAAECPCPFPTTRKLLAPRRIVKRQNARASDRTLAA